MLLPVTLLHRILHCRCRQPMAWLASFLLVFLLVPSMIPGIDAKIGIPYGREELQPFELSSTEEVCRFFDQPVVPGHGMGETAIPQGSSPPPFQIQHVVAQPICLNFDVRDGSLESQNLPSVHHQDTRMVSNMGSELLALLHETPSNLGIIYPGIQETDGTENGMLLGAEEDLNYFGVSAPNLSSGPYRDTVQKVCVAHSVSGSRKRSSEQRYGAGFSKIKLIRPTHWGCDEAGAVKTVFSGSEQNNFGVARLENSSTGSRVNDMAIDKNTTRENFISNKIHPERTMTFSSKQLTPSINQNMFSGSWEAGLYRPFSKIISGLDSQLGEGNVESPKNSFSPLLNSDDDVRLFQIHEPPVLFEVQQVEAEPQGIDNEINIKSTKPQNEQLFTLRQPYPKVFPFIASLKTGSVPQATMPAFWRIYNLSYLSEFRKASLVNISLANPNYSDPQNGHVFHIELQKKLICMFKIIWYLNSKIIESFGVNICDPRFEVEQSNLRSWVSEIFMVQGNQENIVESHMAVNNLMESQNRIQLQDLIIEALIYEGKDTKDDLYAIFEKEKTTITKSKTLLTKACIYIIGSYYKTVSYTKWKCIFQNESKFLEFLAAIKKRIFFGRNRHLTEKMLDSLGKFNIVPWGDEWNLSNTQYLEIRYGFKPLFSKNVLEVVDRYIELQEDLNKRTPIVIKSKPKNCEDKHFIFEKNHSKTYSWIGSISLHSISYLQKELFENNFDYSFTLRLNDKYFLNIFGLSLKEEYTNNQAKCRNRMIIELKNLAKMVWCLNYKVLQCFGFQDSDECFKYEQQSLQKWLLDQILSFNNLAKFPDSIENQYEMSHVPHLTFKILKSNYNKGSGEKTSTDIDFDSPNEGNSGETFIKTVIYIIGEYYKTMNPTKWNCIFKDEECFLGFISIIKRYLDRRDGECLIKKAATRFKPYNIIPWENHWNHGPNNYPVFKAVFQRFLARNSIGWLEKLLEKENLISKMSSS